MDASKAKKEAPESIYQYMVTISLHNKFPFKKDVFSYGTILWLSSIVLPLNSDILNKLSLKRYNYCDFYTL